MSFLFVAYSLIHLLCNWSMSDAVVNTDFVYFQLRNLSSNNAYHIEQFKTSDGRMLLDTQVENLVSAMASFAPPAAGQTSLSPDYESALAPTIAANWQ